MTMMTRAFVLLPILALSACATTLPLTQVSAPPPPPETVTNPQSAKERFVRAAELNGCVVNEATSPAILSGATLSVEELGRIMSELRAEGRGEIAPDGRSFRVTAGACA
ncbi:MAG: hypothetical protein AAFU41_20740 [Pseudomonadota bacterium]